MPETRPPPEWVAYEEASHAVAMVKLGVGEKIEFATIKPGSDYLGLVKHRKILCEGDEDDYQSSPGAMARIECTILVHLAGQYGPHRIAPDTYQLGRNTPDYRLVNELISHLYPSLYDQDNVWPLYLSYMEARAKRLVWQYWKEIEAVAKALLERETLTRDEIIAVIYQANGLPPPELTSIDYVSVWQRVQDTLTNGFSNWQQRALSLGQIQQENRRNPEYRFHDDEIFKGLLLALLSNNTNWAVVERAMPMLSTQFDNFSLRSYVQKTDAQIEAIFQWFISNRTAAPTLRQGLLRLRKAATRLEEVSSSSGGLHHYLENLLKERGGDPIKLAVTLGGTGFGSEHKLSGFGIPLAAEFLKNVGYDVAKPDRHINRALGSFGWISFRNWPDRSGTKAPTPTEKELIAVMQEVARFAESVSASACFVDNVLWVLCARSGRYASNEQLTKIGRLS